MSARRRRPTSTWPFCAAPRRRRTPSAPRTLPSAPSGPAGAAIPHQFFTRAPPWPPVSLRQNGPRALTHYEARLEQEITTEALDALGTLLTVANGAGADAVTAFATPSPIPPSAWALALATKRPATAQTSPRRPIIVWGAPSSRSGSGRGRPTFPQPMMRAAAEMDAALLAPAPHGGSAVRRYALQPWGRTVGLAQPRARRTSQQSHQAETLIRQGAAARAEALFLPEGFACRTLDGWPSPALPPSAPAPAGPSLPGPSSSLKALRSSCSLAAEALDSAPITQPYLGRDGRKAAIAKSISFPWTYPTAHGSMSENTGAGEQLVRRERLHRGPRHLLRPTLSPAF